MSQHWKPLDSRAGDGVPLDDIDDDLHAVATDAEVVTETAVSAPRPAPEGPPADAESPRRRGPLLLVLAALITGAVFALAGSSGPETAPDEQTPAHTQPQATERPEPAPVIGKRKRVKDKPAQSGPTVDKPQIPGTSTGKRPSGNGDTGKPKLPDPSDSTPSPDDIKVPGT